MDRKGAMGLGRAALSPAPSKDGKRKSGVSSRSSVLVLLSEQLGLMAGSFPVPGGRLMVKRISPLLLPLLTVMLLLLGGRLLDSNNGTLKLGSRQIH